MSLLNSCNDRGYSGRIAPDTIPWGQWSQPDKHESAYRHVGFWRRSEGNVIFVTSVSRDSLRDPIKTQFYKVSIIRGKGLCGSSCGDIKEIFASTFLIQGTVLT